jgi:hypothetical protein
MTTSILQHPALIHDGSKVRVLDGGSEVWRGTVLELEQTNQFDDEECAHLRVALFETGKYGGGPSLTVELLGRFVVTVIGHLGTETRYSPTIANALSIADRAFRKSEGTAVVTVFDLESCEAIATKFLPVFERDLMAISMLLNPSRRVA